MSERIRGSYDDELYKSTYTLLYFLMVMYWRRRRLSVAAVMLSCAGNRRHRRCQGSVWHHTDWRQFHKYRQGSDVGPQRLRQHRQVPPVSADGQRGGGYRRISWSLFHSGLPFMPAPCWTFVHYKPKWLAGKNVTHYCVKFINWCTEDIWASLLFMAGRRQGRYILSL